jgi:formate hydrogenlyase transcriptional activator
MMLVSMAGTPRTELLNVKFLIVRARPNHGHGRVLPRVRLDQEARVLRETNGRVDGTDGAAARMGINRTTLISRMKRLGIHANEFE